MEIHTVLLSEGHSFSHLHMTHLSVAFKGFPELDFWLPLEE